jgi:superfamily I DNA/RNA helicase
MVPACDGACAPVAVRQYASQAEEAEALAAEVERLWRQEGVPYSDICVLFRCLRMHGGEPHGPIKAALRR